MQIPQGKFHLGRLWKWAACGAFEERRSSPCRPDETLASSVDVLATLQGDARTHNSELLACCRHQCKLHRRYRVSCSFVAADPKSYGPRGSRHLIDGAIRLCSASHRRGGLQMP